MLHRQCRVFAAANVAWCRGKAVAREGFDTARNANRWSIYWSVRCGLKFPRRLRIRINALHSLSDFFFQVGG